MIRTQNQHVPFFSVIVTTFNRKELISRALESVIKQSFGDWECIIVDDGSTDGTFDVVSRYCNKLDNIKYVYQSNRGPGLAKNTGILASSGLFVSFLDSDDEYLTNHLDHQRNILLSYPDTDFIHSKAIIIGDSFVPDINNPKRLINLNECVIGGTFVINKELAISIGGYPDLRFGDDTALYNKAKESGLIIRKSDLKTYKYYRNSKDSICNNM